LDFFFIKSVLRKLFSGYSAGLPAISGMPSGYLAIACFIEISIRQQGETIF
jgi:hypothetical protein